MKKFSYTPKFRLPSPILEIKPKKCDMMIVNSNTTHVYRQNFSKSRAECDKYSAIKKVRTNSADITGNVKFNRTRMGSFHSKMIPATISLKKYGKVLAYGISTDSGIIKY